MTLRAADLRFVLPHSVRTATVLDEDTDATLGAIKNGLDAAGVRGGHHNEKVDLVVATARGAERALDVPARSHVLLGKPDPRIVSESGRLAAEHFVLGRVDRPTTLVPARSARSLGYYLNSMAVPAEPLHRMRNRGARVLLRGHVPISRFVPSSRVVTVLISDRDRGRPPHLLSVASDAAELTCARTGWILALGTGDDLQRAVFHVLDDRRVGWVLKFSRVTGAVDAFDRDATGLELARSAGPVVAAHAPSLLARIEVDGRPGAVETAGAGRPLVSGLTRRSEALVETIAQWIVDMGATTAVPPERLGHERSRLEAEVLPAWALRGAPPDLVAGLPAVPGVLQHNDLGSWNIVSDGTDFTAVDWESARAVGLPLWDMLYFLADSLVRMEGPADVETLEHRCLALFRGTSPYSPTLFGWVRLAAARLGIPSEAVGPIATLCWMHHGLSATLRQSALGEAAPAEPGHLARLAAPWLADPDLGPTWSCWRAD